MKLSFDFTDVELQVGKVYRYSYEIERNKIGFTVSNPSVVRVYDKEKKAIKKKLAAAIEGQATQYNLGYQDGLEMGRKENPNFD